MKLKVLEPGDGSRYLVAFAPLSEEAAKLAGHAKGGLFFGIALGDNPMTAYTFSSVTNDYLSWGYFLEKMAGLNERDVHTLCVGYYVLLALTGRPGGEAPIPQEDIFTKSLWQLQLLGGE